VNKGERGSSTSLLSNTVKRILELTGSDGVHLTTAGYDVLWAEIDKLVHTEFKGRGIDWDDQDDCPWTAPE
jgi:hypothetical protein